MTRERLHEWRTVIWLVTVVSVVAAVQFAWSFGDTAGALTVLGLFATVPFAIIGAEHALAN